MIGILHPVQEEDHTNTDERKLAGLVDELCRTTTAEQRAHVAVQLRNAVDSVTEVDATNLRASFDIDHVQERGPAVAALTFRLQTMLTSDNPCHRLGAIEAFSALMFTETESIHSRTQRTSNAIRALFNSPVTDIATAGAAAKLVASFSRTNSPMSARAVNHTLRNALSLIINPAKEKPHPQLSRDRARAAMVITELAAQDKVQNLVFKGQGIKLRKQLWNVCWDNDSAVREQGVRALQAIFSASVNRAKKEDVEKAMRDVMVTIRNSLACQSSPNFAANRSPEVLRLPVVHGSLSMLHSLLGTRETREYMRTFSEELCDLVLPYQTCSEQLLRKAVADILPLLVQLDWARFAEKFLDSVHKSTLALIRNETFPPDERGLSLLSFSVIAEQMPRNDDSPMMTDLLGVCRDSLCEPYKLTLPQRAVIKTISHLAKASRGSPVFEQAVRDGMLTIVFNSDFTNDLVDAVIEISRALPTYAGLIRLRLVHLIAATLKKWLPNRKDGIMGNSPTSSVNGSLRSVENMMARGSVGRTRSFLSLGQNSLNLSQSASRQASSPSRQSNRDGRLSGQSYRRVEPSARDFFREVPISKDLHRIDSSSILSSKPSAKSLDSLVREDLMASSSNGTSLDYMHGNDVMDNDQENSPCVALKAIINLDFSDMRVQDFISLAAEFVIGYAEYNSVKVRALSIAASAKLMASAAKLWAGPSGGRRRPNELRRGIHAILDQILAISVADPSTDVRFIAIRSLDEPVFRPYLMQPEMLSKLFLCLHDSSLMMRDSALSMAGDLSRENPAEILPVLRDYLVHLLTILRCDGVFFDRDRREATELIYTLVHNGANLIMPYTSSLMDAILMRLQEAQRSNEPTIALPVLQALAELGGTMSRIDLGNYEAQLVPLLIVSVLEAPSAEPTYKKAAIRALTAYVQNTGQATKPYVLHSSLLSELIQLITNESDSEVRIAAGILLGSLGAVDPADNKYAAVIDYAGKKQSRAGDRLSGGDSQGSSVFRMANSALHGPGYFPPGASGSQYGRNSRGSIRRSPLTQQYGQTHQTKEAAASAINRNPHHEQSPKSGNSHRPDPGAAHQVRNVVPSKSEYDVSLSQFALGGPRVLERMAGYYPCWAEEEMPNSSLMALLEHPFTASPDFFPSAALDILHKIIRNPRLRVHHREACQAIVSILKSVGLKCVNFLHAVVPRILWLLHHSSSRDPRLGSTFTQIQQHIMQRLADIIATSGHNYMPYTFDTVLLVWTYLSTSKNSVACITSSCTLLSRLRTAIGDEFKPIIPTVLPPLLSALAKDSTVSGVISTAVLRTLESFGSLIDEYRKVVLIGITRVTSSSRLHVVREQAMSTLILLLKDMRSVEAISSVIHPLLIVLSGAQGRHFSGSRDRPEDGSPGEQKHETIGIERLSTLAASALAELGKRTGSEFDLFVPVVTKALKAGNVGSINKGAYRTLRLLLIEKDPVVVRELLGDDTVPSERNSHLVSESDNETSEIDGLEDLEFDVSPGSSVRGGAFEGRPSLPYGTRTTHPRAHVLEEALVNKWEVSQNFTAEDWNVWYENVGATMFEQSGSPAFRACGRISDSYPPFIRQLLNPAFLSCWKAQLTDHTRTKICDSLELALTSESIPLTVLQGLLNLFEFMDHDEKPLPVRTERLASTACKCGAYAKAIRYREQDYGQHLEMPELLREDVCGKNGLIAIYEKLGQNESAIGTLREYRETTGEVLQEEWLERLQRWDDALAVYDQTEMYIIGDNPKVPPGLTAGEALYSDKKGWSHLLGKLRCLNELGKWREMNFILRRAREALIGENEALCQLALEGKGASVAFDLELWGEFEEWVNLIPPQTYERSFYSTLVFIKRGKDNRKYLDAAEAQLREARRKLDLDLTARVSEGYPSAYNEVVSAQVLVELEEIIQYLRMRPRDAAVFGKQRLQSIWTDRLKRCKQDWFTWYKLLMIRSLVMKPVENKDQWLEFAGMCRKTHRLPLASEALRMLITSCAERRSTVNPAFVKQGSSGSHLSHRWDVESVMNIDDLEVRFACIKHLWALDQKEPAYNALSACCNEYLPEGGVANFLGENPRIPTENFSEDNRTLAGEVFSKLSKWGHKLLGSVNCRRKSSSDTQLDSEDPLVFAERATVIRPDWYKAWHYWGEYNAVRFEKLVETEASALNMKKDPSRKGWHNAHLIQEIRPGHRGRAYLVQAIKGYFKSIDLEGKTRLQDSLKILTLWFNYGGHAGLHAFFDEYFRVTNIAMWLEVVPQIIARLYSPSPNVQRGVRELLTRIGQEHPQVAVYPLTVARGPRPSRNEDSREAAATILDDLRRNHSEIVEQSEMVATELVRSAILWVEQWHERLEEASKCYFVEKNVEGMIDLLLPLHEDLESGPETACERNFAREFGAELAIAGGNLRNFRAGYESDEDVAQLQKYLSDAWQVYQSAFKRIQRLQQSTTIVDLGNVSDRLSNCSNLLLAVPGTYDPLQSKKAVGIYAFEGQMQVVQSKQRPRKMSILGSDGQQYRFLLKGHEDLRQDERVMQVFNLINRLFGKGGRKDLLNGVELKTYAVVALSANAGLIGWVPDCDTMHALVKEYRDARSIMTNVEHKVMLNIAPEPDRLPLLHKVDLFELMLDNTVSQDIAKVLWLRSRNSELWLDKRSTYARSLATTSMAGYLLGLGDRHPSNIMIERFTGRVLHIDFGDCFEVATKREKYPEKVPFRLTRMLVQALEPCGVQGYFQQTAEATMEVLRQQASRESLMAMMEVFVYDPLIRWKLVTADEMARLKQEEAVDRHAERETPGQSQSMSASLTNFSDPGLRELARSIQETGSLAASVRRLSRQERHSAAAAAETAEGAIPTPSQDNGDVDDDDVVDPANLQTPSARERLQQMRVMQDEDPNQPWISSAANAKAQLALNRFEDKLRGTDFGCKPISVEQQVMLLIKEARSVENLCALFMGWCAFW